MTPQQIEDIVDRELGRVMRHHASTAALQAEDTIRQPGWHNVARAHLQHALACCEAVEAMLLAPGSED